MAWWWGERGAAWLLRPLVILLLLGLGLLWAADAARWEGEVGAVAVERGEAGGRGAEG